MPPLRSPQGNSDAFALERRCFFYGAVGYILMCITICHGESVYTTNTVMDEYNLFDMGSDTTNNYKTIDNVEEIAVSDPVVTIQRVPKERSLRRRLKKEDVADEDIERKARREAARLAAMDAPPEGWVDPPKAIKTTETSQEQKRARRLEPQVEFKQLWCNYLLMQQPCVPWSEQNYNTNRKITIPCGKCIKMDQKNGEILKLFGGIDIQGRLDFPPGTKVKIITPYIFVQGQLSMTIQDVIKGADQEHVKIVFIGKQDVLFVPHTTNKMACGGSGFACNVGSKAMVVAGGQLNIKGMTRGCPAWFKAQDAERTSDVGTSWYVIPDTVQGEWWDQEDGVCNNLARTHGQPYSKYVYTDEYTKELDATDNVTMIHKLSNRDKPYSSISWGVDPFCAKNFNVYNFNADIMVRNDVATEITVLLKVYHATDPSLDIVEKICACESSEKMGWVTCACEKTFRQRHEDARMLEILFRLNDTVSDIWWKNINFTFNKKLRQFPDSEITLSRAVSNCWGEGSFVLVTSQTTDYTDSKVYKIKEAKTTGLMLKTGAFSTDRSEMPELAILNRNILFAAHASDEKQGAHLIIMNTPDKDQMVEGVAFMGFGQQGNDGRYPINFHMNQNIGGTYISKNLILNSYQRCIVIHGTNNAVLADNVAYNVQGHCYMTEDGSEVGNVFKRNLGAFVNPVTKVLDGALDSIPAIFYLRNPDNSVVENVAAGSADSGFFLHFRDSVQGDSAEFHPDVVPREITMKKFAGNTAHSNSMAGIKMYTYVPKEQSILENSRIYKNQMIGIALTKMEKVSIIGGYVADNKIGIDLNLANSVTISGVHIVGSTEGYRKFNQFLSRNANWLENAFCSKRPEKNTKLIGIEFHTTMTDETQSGPSVEDVVFENFGFEGSGGCAASMAIAFQDELNKTHYDSQAHLSTVTFNNIDISRNKINLCKSISSHKHGDYIEDSDGVFNPNGDGTPGFVVNDKFAITTFEGDDKCIKLEGGCAKFCPNLCMRVVNVKVTPHDTEGGRVLVKNLRDEWLEMSCFWGGTGDCYDDTLWTKRRDCYAVLPQGNYTVYFRDKDDKLMWPNAVEVFYGKPPESCTNYVENIDIFYPELPKDYCSHGNLITDPTFKSKDFHSNGWYHTGGGLKLMELADKSYALTTQPRVTTIMGPAYFIDTRCLKEGDIIEIEAEIRLMHNRGYFAACDTSLEVGTMVCPSASIVVKKGGVTANVKWDVTATSSEWKYGGEWNIMFGRIKIDAAMAEADTMAVFVARQRRWVMPVLNRFDVKVKSGDICNHMVQNGNFDMGSTHWKIIGGTIPLVLADKLAGGEERKMVRISKRKEWYHGMGTYLDTACFDEGDVVLVTGTMRLVTGTNIPLNCNPATSRVSPIACPIVGIKAKRNVHIDFFEVAGTVGPYKQNQWNKFYGVFKVTKEMSRARTLMLFVNRAYKNVDIVLEDLSAKQVTGDDTVFGYPTCDQVIRNNDGMSGNTTFWLSDGEGIITVARTHERNTLHHRNRGNWYTSMFQHIADPSCFTFRSRWKFEGSFYLYNSVSPYNAWECDKRCNSETPDNIKKKCNKSAGRCPWMAIHFKGGPEEQPSKYIHLGNQINFRTPWDKTRFNKFEQELTITRDMLEYKTWSVLIVGAKANINVAMTNLTLSPMAQG